MQSQLFELVVALQAVVSTLTMQVASLSLPPTPDADILRATVVAPTLEDAPPAPPAPPASPDVEPEV